MSGGSSSINGLAIFQKNGIVLTTDLHTIYRLRIVDWETAFAHFMKFTLVMTAQIKVRNHNNNIAVLYHSFW